MRTRDDRLNVYGASMSDPALRDLLASYVPRLIHKRIIHDPVPIEAPLAEELDAVVLFADISGFTRLTEQIAERGPQGVEAIANLLNEYFGQLIGTISEYGGDVLKFAGDAILAVWPFERGTPGAARAWTLHAAECALRIRDRLHDYKIEDAQMRLKIALGAGPVNLVHVGGVFSRWEFLITGSPLVEVSLANNMAQAGQVLLTPSAWIAIRDLCSGTPLEFRLPEGVREGIRLDRLSRPSEMQSAPPAPELPDDAESFLKAYIPGSVINRLSAGHSGWIAELRKVTVLFIKLPDLDEHTSLEEAQSMARLLQRSVYRYEGSLNKISVDDKGITVVAGFGLPPLSHEDDPARGVQAAMLIRDELQALNVRCALGVTTGRIFCGAVGNHQRREYTIIGNAVNLAARLMSLAATDSGESPPIRILCDRPTYDGARAVIEFEGLGTRPVKGRTEAVEVFQPLALRKSLVRARADLIGREEEKSILATSLQELQRGRSRQTVVLRGEAGIGKSRLTEEAARQADQLQLNVLRGSGDAIDKSTPYHAWKPVFARLFDLERLFDQPQPSEDQRSAIREQVAQKLAGVDAELERYAPLLSVVLPADIPENEFTAAMSGEIRGGNIRELLVRLLNFEADRRALVILLEDLHWFDSASWSLLLDVRQRVHPALLVLNTRPLPEPLQQDYLRLTEGAQARVIDLEALPLADVESLVCQRLGILAAPPEIGRLIREKSEGHPFFAEELAYALRDTGIIQIEGQTCRLSSRFTNIDEISLPDSLQAAITSRIDALNPSQQLTLKVASVIGRIFALRLLREIYPVEAERPALAGHLEALTSLNLTVVESEEPDLEYIFKHAVTQEVAYNLMLFSQRRQLHETVAAWIEDHSRTDLSQNYTLLAYHWGQAAGLQEAGGDAATIVKALEYLDKAGDQSLNAFANREAIHFFRDALTLGRQAQADAFRRAQWHRKLGQAYLGLGNLEPARGNFLRALELLGQRVPAAGIGMALGLLLQLARQTAHRLLPKPVRGRNAGQEAFRLEAVQNHLQLATALFLIADPDPLPLFYSVVANLNVAESLGETPVLGYVYAQMGAICGFVPAPSQYRHYSAQAERIMQRFDHSRYYVGAQLSLAAYESGIGLWQDLKPRLEKAITLCDEVGDNRQMGEALAYLGANAEIAGDVRELEQYNRRLWECAQRRENPVQILWSRQLACSIAARLGRTAEAIGIANEALYMMEKTWVGEATDTIVRSALASARWQNGERAAAWESAGQLLERLAKSSIVDYSIYLAYSHLMQIVLDALEGDAPPGVERAALELYPGLLERILKKYCAIFRIGEPAHAYVRGCLAWRRKRPEQAYRMWRQAAARAGELGMALEAGRAHLALGEHLPPAHTERRAHLKQARELFATAGFENWAGRAAKND
jgi:class 3 adenylate cyclase